MKKVKVAVIGATGYTGEELVRLLARHPRAQITYVSGRENRSTKIQDIFPYLKHQLDLDCLALSVKEACRKADFIFLSLPHTVSMQFAPLFLAAGKKVVDISADYRLKDAAMYENFYRTRHGDVFNLKHAVYGLPETNRDKIRSARLVANPGCYPTGAVLGLLPGFENNLFETDSIVIDAKSGVTGAGRNAEKALNFSEVNESFKAYKPFEHPHVPEIDQTLSGFAGKKIRVAFVPHLVPMNRGILSALYVRLRRRVNTARLLEIYQKFYAKEPFVKVYCNGQLPEIKHVAFTNFCDIGLRVSDAKRLAFIVTAIDNLGKGAAGQAVQNMNLMLGFDERTGL